MSYKGLLITGGCLRPDGFELGEGKYYGNAKLLLLDLTSGESRELLSKSDGGANYPSQHPNQQFTAACLDGDTLWLPTDTEILKYQLPQMELTACFSYPCFNNIHSVHVFGDELVATSTGIDNVIVMDKHSGDIKHVINTEGKDPWHRFNAETDYRFVYSTRPHDSHPNFIFLLDGEMWVTRCKQEDAVCLSDVSKCIDVSQRGRISIHDGLWWQDKLVFTRVDGFLVICDPISRKVIENHDPFSTERNRPLGWCRGLHIDGDLFYIGYSKLRKTKLTSKLKFISQGNFKYRDGNDALVVAYNIKTQKVERTYQFSNGVIDAIYGILPFNYG